MADDSGAGVTDDLVERDLPLGEETASETTGETTVEPTAVPSRWLL